MFMLASRPRASDQLLLHAGAGGVGLAAGEYSHWLRARPSATVGRPYKHFYLHALGLKGRTLSSRDGGAFVVGQSTMLRGSRLRGVLNSLSADFIAGSFALLGEDGRLGEIGKRAVYSQQRRKAATPSAQYHVIALDSTIEQTPWWMRGVLQLLSSRASVGVLHGLPMAVYDMERRMLAAFRSLQSGSNTGKVVIRIPTTLPPLPSATHLLTGGSGGLGLLTGRWLAESGATSVVLASRGGKVSGDEAERLQAAVSCNTRTVRCDAAEPVDVRHMLCGVMSECASPLSGVWHAAGVLSDGLLRTQTASTIKRVYAPKVRGAWALQQACAWSVLDACVLFSSVAALLGGGGQSNYSAANCCLDALGALRRGRAQMASSVQWGPWADVGMVAGGAVNARIQASGMGLITMEQGMVAWKASLQPQVPGSLGLVILTWSRFLSLMPEVPPLLRNFAHRKAAGAVSGAATTGEVKEVTLEMIVETLK